MDLLSAWKITPGSKDVTIALVDHFTVQGQFNFADVFFGCKDRVRFFSPFTYKDHYQPATTSLHGEALLLALGACNNVHPFGAGVDGHAQILAAEPPSFGHGEIFFTALLAGGIDVCKESVISCPADLAINISSSKPDVLLLPFGNNAPDLLQISADMTFALNQKGVIVVTGAGNDQANANNSFPGASPYVINVAAINKDGERTAFSNWGLSVDLMAPGADLDFVFPNGEKNISGTSVSAAFVAGAVSLLKSLKKDLSFEEAQHVLTASATPMTCEEYCQNALFAQGDPCEDFCCVDTITQCGKRTLNLAAALRYLEKMPPLPLLKLDKTYLLYLRDESSPKEVEISNIGSVAATIVVTAFDDHIDIAPRKFVLKERGQVESHETLRLSFKREPFIRQTFKFEVAAFRNDQVVDKQEFYLEYIPKN
jgi:hypothetical protein